MNQESSRPPSPLLTFCIVAASSLCFCTKGVFAKLAYAAGADSITVLALRMGMALPVFLAVGWWSGRKNPPVTSAHDWVRLTVLGFLGYYLSSYVNFSGLQFISVGLERIVLYTYPCLVLLGSAVFYRRRIRPAVWGATAVAYAGIVCAFAGESMQGRGSRENLLLGTGLVFVSALTYAWFILASGELLRRMGPAAFTSRVVGLSCVMILLHYCATRPLAHLVALPGRVYGYGAVLALLGTVAPSYLLGFGLKRAGAQKFAVISTVGPVATILLAWPVLGESLHGWQIAGFLLSLGGGLAVSLLKDRAGAAPVTASLASVPGTEFSARKINTVCYSARPTMNEAILQTFSTQIAKAGVLIEAMPYLQRFRGQTFLIKFGGSAMDDPELVEGLLRDIVFMELAGINPVVVHGGGKAISKAMNEAGLEAKFVGGLRVTDERAIGIVERVLFDVVNRDLVETINRFGGRAVGLHGKSVFIGKRNPPVKGEDGAPVDLGFVGTVHDFLADDVIAAVKREEVPVISPVACEEGTGAALNVNADIAAASLAGKMKAAKFVYISDVLGVMRDPSDPSSLLPSLNRAAVEKLVNERVITGGMIPKVRSAISALDAGVQKVHMIDGRIPHSLLLEIFTESGIGTEIVP